MRCPGDRIFRRWQRVRRLLAKPAMDPQPRKHPHQTSKAGNKKDHRPPETTAYLDANGKSAVGVAEMFRDRFGCGDVVPCLPKSEQKTASTERQTGTCKGRQHFRQRPPHNEQCHAPAAAETVSDITGQ